MKTKLSTLILAVCLAFGTVQSAMAQSNLKKSDMFGDLPALYENSNFLKSDLNERYRTMNAEQYTKAREAYQKEKDKLDAAINAEKEKLNGKDVPFAFSAGFQAKPTYKVSSVKLSGSDFNVVIEPIDEGAGFSATSISYRYIGKDGSTIYIEDEISIYGTKFTLTGLYPDDVKPEQMIDFKSIEFMTKEEAVKLQN